MIKHSWRNLKSHVACVDEVRGAWAGPNCEKSARVAGFAPVAAVHDRRNFSMDYAKEGIATVKANVWAFVDGHIETHQWTYPDAIRVGLEASQGIQFDSSSTPWQLPDTTSDYAYIRNRWRFPGWE